MKKRIEEGIYLVKKKFREKQIPLGITIIALLYYIIAFSSLIFGIVTLIGGLLSGSGFIIANSIFFIAIGIFMYFIGRNLWEGKNWARIVAIILTILIIFSSFFYTIQGQLGNFFSILINLIIGGYLIFDKNVKKIFTNPKEP